MALASTVTWPTDSAESCCLLALVPPWELCGHGSGLGQKTPGSRVLLLRSLRRTDSEVAFFVWPLLTSYQGEAHAIQARDARQPIAVTVWRSFLLSGPRCVTRRDSGRSPEHYRKGLYAARLEANAALLHKRRRRTNPPSLVRNQSANCFVVKTSKY